MLPGITRGHYRIQDAEKDREINAVRYKCQHPGQRNQTVLGGRRRQPPVAPAELAHENPHRVPERCVLAHISKPLAEFNEFLRLAYAKAVYVSRADDGDGPLDLLRRIEGPRPHGL